MRKAPLLRRTLREDARDAGGSFNPRHKKDRGKQEGLAVSANLGSSLAEKNEPSLSLLSDKRNTVNGALVIFRTSALATLCVTRKCVSYFRPTLTIIF